MRIVVHGLKNCDTCRKAVRWLGEQGADAQLRDVRSEPLKPSEAKGGLARFGADRLINRRGTTWRGLSDAEKNSADGDKAPDLLLANPALMKRPIFEAESGWVLGFGETERAKLMDLLKK